MINQEITEKYLPMLQDMQRTVCRRDDMSMSVQAFSTNISVFICAYDNHKITETILRTVGDYLDESINAEAIIDLNAFIAKHCTVRAEEFETCNN